ncbi:hypothetical protein H5410_040961, partial [Solanum commersonii]
PSTSSCSVSLGNIVLLCRIIRRNVDCSFHRLFDPAPSGLCILEQRVESLQQISKCAWRCSGFSLFIFFGLFLFKKDVSNSATQDSIMNAHNKTEITHAKINYVLKDSSCDTQLPKILMLAILATCACSSSTKNQESDSMRILIKRNTMHVFTHRLSLIFQLIFILAHSRLKKKSF